MRSRRWDQGRILYFQYDVLRDIACVLLKYDGKNVNDNDIAIEFKNELIKITGLPFSPLNYKVIRNYSRVFQCAMLATVKDRGVLVVSDIGKQLSATNSLFESADDYLFEIVNRFRYPFPAFMDYESESERIYPFCCLIKYLIAKIRDGKEPSASLQEIGDYIIGNNCTGFEDVDFYASLPHSGNEIMGDSLRQLREMLVFISQISFLKIYDGKVYLDVLNAEDADIILKQLKPVDNVPSPSRTDEFLNLTQIKNRILIPKNTIDKGVYLPTIDSFDAKFAEGKRTRAYHLRIERSPMLRRIYMKEHPEPICDACKLHLRERYPWTNYMLDLHHLLPLSSAIRTLETGTSLSDLVGLCPSCHRAVHSFYGIWLKANRKEDFQSKEEAKSVYLEAIREIV